MLTDTPLLSHVCPPGSSPSSGGLCTLWSDSTAERLAGVDSCVWQKKTGAEGPVMQLGGIASVSSRVLGILQGTRLKAGTSDLSSKGWNGLTSVLLPLYFLPIPGGYQSKGN